MNYGSPANAKLCRLAGEHRSRSTKARASGSVDGRFLVCFGLAIALLTLRLMPFGAWYLWREELALLWAASSLVGTGSLLIVQRLRAQAIAGLKSGLSSQASNIEAPVAAPAVHRSEA